VDGGSLANRTRGEPQPPPDAARLVETLARAIEAAHQRGIVHRDLKPANILLAKGGVASGGVVSGEDGMTTHQSPLTTHHPKIADFGLAKRSQGNGIGTISGAILGTPAYMAPEQASGDGRAVGPLVDVYALGVILYELLTGRPPFRGTTLYETLDQVRTREPVLPRHLQPKVPRDLETICLKCLQKEPRRRYPSALTLADDLRRFAVGEPIAARPVSPWERALKWAKRRPAVPALTALLMVTIVVAFALVTWKWREELRQRDLVQAQRDQAARAFFQLARFTEHRTSRSDAIAIYERSLALFEELVHDNPTKAEYRAFLAFSYNNLGLLYRDTGKRSQAEQSLQKGLALRETLVSDDPANSTHRNVLAASHHNLAVLYRETRNRPKAEEAWRKAIALRKPLVDEHPTIIE
jgi:hypothetical protein